MESLTIRTKRREIVPHDLSIGFYEFPSYLRRAAIAEALGAMTSWHTRHKAWVENGSKGKGPGLPRAGRTFPVLYEKYRFSWHDRYSARIKVFIRNTWDWMDVALKKTDVDYIERHHKDKKGCCPTLVRKGRSWKLDFSFEEDVRSRDLDAGHKCVDLGLDHACVCSAMV